MDCKSLVPSLPLTLQGDPHVITIHRAFGGSSNYSYKFDMAAETSTKYKATCQVMKLAAKKNKSVTTQFRLLQDRPNLWILICDKINNKAISPVISLPIEYKPKINSWVLTGSFDQVRALFTLNTFQDGFGLLSSIGCSYTTVQFHCVTRFMTMTCYGFGGFELSQAKLDERTVDDDEEKDEQVTLPNTTNGGFFESVLDNKSIAPTLTTVGNILSRLVQ